MKDISNQSIAVFIAVVLLFSLIADYAITKKNADNEYVHMTGAATEAGIQLCINHEPIVNYSCSSNAYAGTKYTCNMDAGGDIDQNLTFYDNTTLFEINHTNGIINFTPIAADIGFYHINITATDNSTCSNNRNSTDFILNITLTAPAYCGDGTCNGGETCSACSQDCGTCTAEEVEEEEKGRGAGGRIGAAEEKLQVDIMPETIKVILKQGEHYTLDLTVTNKGDYEVDMLFSISSKISEFSKAADDYMVLKPGEGRKTSILFSIPISYEPGVYTGMLIAESKNKKGEIVNKYFPIIVEIESVDVILDSSIYLAPEYRQVLAGQSIIAQINFFNLKKTGTVNMAAEYIIKDMYNKVISSEIEEISLADQKSLTKTMKIPDDAAEGDYAFIVQARYKESFSTSSQLFSVVKTKEKMIEEPKQLAGNIYIYAILISLVIVIFSISMMSKHTKSKISRFEQEGKEELKKKIEMLENAYEAEYMKMHGLIESAEKGKMKELEDYIHKMLDKGFGRDQIKDHLKKHGWLESHIDHALSNLRIREIEKEIDRLRDSLSK